MKMYSYYNPVTFLIISKEVLFLKINSLNGLKCYLNLSRAQSHQNFHYCQTFSDNLMTKISENAHEIVTKISTFVVALLFVHCGGTEIRGII